MRVDWQTLQDLGILHPVGHQASLYDWANFTRTAGGAQLLKKRFQHPISDVHALRDTQAAVVWLAEHPDLLTPLLESSAWMSVERYVDSSVTALEYPNRLFRWLDSWWVRYLNADLYNEVGAALALSQTLVRCAAALVEDLSAVSLPPVLSTWRARVRECIDSPPLSGLRASAAVHRLRPPRVLVLDGDLRKLDFAPLRQLANLVYEIDALSSLALATRGHGLVIPEILEEGPPGIEARGLYHPLLDQPVPNPLEIRQGASLVFLTGPNMAGKSTYLKAAGLAVYLAQIGMGVPASALRMTPFACSAGSTPRTIFASGRATSIVRCVGFVKSRRFWVAGYRHSFSSTRCSRGRI